ncbi:MFS transporter [Acidithrix sp. C25]|uniref:MFS transporter n=1 Tax=Acidithrix sp. C25 TaxID=1671482 RepID=UPI00191BAD7F|nr:MFS transporter [Acidithrix sp. C25]CAG4908536.1 unnamed protein product [Acidithrix sp. C25]
MEIPTRMRMARLSTLTYFYINGFILGVWVIQIPTVAIRSKVNPATLGWLLLCLGVGALVSMAVVGKFADRLSARLIVPTSAFGCAMALFFPLRASNWWELAIVLFSLGISVGALDISMNTHAIEVERSYRRPIMSSFHATFSIGGFSSSIYSSQLATYNVSPDVIVDIAVVLSALASVIGVLGLLKKDAVSKEARSKVIRSTWKNVPREIRIFAVVALAVMVSEGIANDWSSLYMQSIRHAPANQIPYAYGAFAATMTIGRAISDRLAKSYSSLFVLRYGATLALVGITVVIFAPSTIIAISGWAIFGLGLSGCVPQIYSAAGHFDANNAGANVSKVASVGYFGMLAGPLVIGQLTKVVSLQYTFFVPAILCIVAIVFSGVIRSHDHKRLGANVATDTP